MTPMSEPSCNSNEVDDLEMAIAWKTIHSVGHSEDF